METVKFDDMKKDTSGEFGGLGIVVSIKDNYVTVVAPMVTLYVLPSVTGAYSTNAA